MAHEPLRRLVPAEHKKPAHPVQRPFGVQPWPLAPGLAHVGPENSAGRPPRRRAPPPQGVLRRNPAAPLAPAARLPRARPRPLPRAHLPAAPSPQDAAPSGAGQRLGGGSWGRGPGAPPLPYLRGAAGAGPGRGLVPGAGRGGPARAGSAPDASVLFCGSWGSGAQRRIQWCLSPGRALFSAGARLPGAILSSPDKAKNLGPKCHDHGNPLEKPLQQQPSPIPSLQRLHP